MDRTLKRAKRNNKRRGQRNHGAWQRFAPDGKTCRYCEHDGSLHLCQSGQPHYFRPATEAEGRSPSVMLYRHTPVSSTGQALPESGSIPGSESGTWLVRRMTVDNREYTRLLNQAARQRKRGNQAEALQLRKQMQQLPSRDPYDPGYRRLRYVRYADDFVLGFSGPKAEAEQIRESLGTFLRDSLKLELSKEKTLITHATSQAARFLGYELVNQHANDQFDRNGRRRVNGQIGLRVPAAVIEQHCQAYMRKGKPAHRNYLIHDEDYGIVAQYQSEFRGVVNYYLLAYNVSHFGRLQSVMEMSLARTLAAKHKSTARRMRRQYKSVVETEHGPRVCLKVVKQRDNGKPPRVAYFGGIPLKRQRQAVLVDQQPQRYRAGRNELIKRLEADECEMCGSKVDIEVHHIRALCDLNVKGRREKSKWVQIMAARRRKTLVVCRTCHMDIQHGRNNPRKQP